MMSNVPKVTWLAGGRDTMYSSGLASESQLHALLFLDLEGVLEVTPLSPQMLTHRYRVVRLSPQDQIAD